MAQIPGNLRINRYIQHSDTIQAPQSMYAPSTHLPRLLPVVYLFALIHCFHVPASAQQMAGREIDADNRATFRIKAPGAREVKIIVLSDEQAMGAPEYALSRGADSIWTVTTLPCRPGFHYYELSIDGFRCADPASPHYFGWARWTSALEVPDPALDFYLPRQVPHGEVRQHWYRSETTGAYRKCLVYTPPGYDRDLQIRYPVLFLQHGSGESELGWTMQGKANFILDNLIAGGEAVPMIIVMDNGYAARPGAENPAQVRGADNRFADLVVDELVPLIDRDFRTIGNRENRAIAGLSMGAGQALQIGLNHPEQFASIGAFSGGSRSFDAQSSYSGAFRDTAAFNERYRLFWIGCGTLDGGYASAVNMHEALDRHGIRHVWYSGPGSHEWQVWRHHLREFARLLFK